MKPARSPDRLFQVIIGVAAGMILLHTAILVLKPPERSLAEIPSFVPMTHGFLVLEALTIGLLTLGRHRVLNHPPAYWIGVAFSGFAITNFVYILTWPGILASGNAILGHLPDTAAWIIVPGQAFFAILLVVAGLARWPAEGALKGDRWSWSLAGWLVFFTLAALFPILLEGRLPPALGSGDSFSPLLAAWTYTLILLYAAAAVVLAVRYRRERYSLAGFLAVNLTLLCFYAVENSIAGERYVLLWYTSRLLAVLGGLVVLAGLVWEYIHLYLTEQQKTSQLVEAVAERERAKAALREIAATLEQRVTEQTEELRKANEELERRVQVRTVELQDSNRDLKGSRVAALNLLEDALYAQGQLQKVYDRLRESEERFSKAFQSSPAGINMFRISDGTSLDANDAFLELVGYAREEVVGHTAQELNLLVNPEERKTWLEAIQNHNTVHDLDIRIRRKSGEIVNALFSVVELEIGGEKVGLIQAVDITARKQAELELQKAREEALHRAEELEALMESIPVGVLITQDDQGLVITGNRAAHDLLRVPYHEPNLSVSAPDPLGLRTYRVIKDGAELPPEELPIQKAARGLETRNWECDLIFRDGEVRSLLHHATPLYDERGQPRGAVSAFMDISDRKRMEVDLEKAQFEAESRAIELDATFDSIADAVIVYDADRRVRLANTAALRLVGFDLTRENLAGVTRRLSIQTVEGEPLDLARMPASRALKGEKVTGEVYIIHTPQGAVKTVLASALPLRFGERIEGAVVSWKDITEQRSADERQAWLASFPELNPNPIVELEADGSLHYINPVARQLFPDLETLGKDHPLICGLESVVHAFQEGDSQVIIRDQKVGKALYQQTISYLPHTGRVRVYCTDVTVRKNAEDQLRRMRDELEQRVRDRTRELNASNEKLRMEIEERQRMADSLHDAVNQSMFSAGLIAEILPNLWERDREEARQSLKDLRRLTRSAQGEMRALLVELSPSVMANNGLDYFLDQLSNAFSGRTNVPVKVKVSGEPVLPPEAQVVFYRVAQEALNNIAKHARATQVEIQFVQDRERVTLLVTDNGMGFSPENVTDNRYGLSMMQARADSIGAVLTIDTRPGAGTRLLLDWDKDGTALVHET